MNSLIYMFGYVYLVTNKVNNKIYVGQHRSNVFDKEYYGSGTIISSAIKKYGINNFKIDILSWASNRNELNMLEKFYIKVYNSTNNKIGYNIQFGGQGSYVSENRIYLYGKDNPCYGMKRTDEQKKRLKEIHKELRLQGKCGVKGRIAITDGKVTKFIYPEELNTYLNTGWYKGKMPCVKKNANSKNQNNIRKSEEYKAKRLMSGITCDNVHQTTLGRKCINDGVKCKCVFDFELDQYLKSVWKLGRVELTKEQRNNMSKAQKKSLEENPDRLNKLVNRFRNSGYTSTKGKVCMNNGITNIYVLPNEVSNYIDKCFQIGGKQKSKNHRSKISESNRGKLTFTNGIINVRCDPSESEKYINMGYYRGLTKKKGRDLHGNAYKK